MNRHRRPIAHVGRICLTIAAFIACAEPVCVEPGPEEPPACELTPLSNPCPTDIVIQPPDALAGDCTRSDDGAPCELPCFGESICVDGECQPVLETEAPCPQSEDPCVIAVACDPATGQCTLALEKLEGDWCNNDQDFCTLEKCDIEGLCVSTEEIITCDGDNALDPCRTWTCLPTEGCIEGPFTDGESCEDGDPCTGPDTCQLAINGCAGDPLPLDDQNICTTDSCEDGSIIHDPLICVQPPDKCAGTNLCDPKAATAECTVDPTTAVECDAPSAPCTINQCNPVTGQCDTLSQNQGEFCCEDTVISNETECPTGVPSGFCISGTCCVPSCGTIECGADGCGGFCPCPGGQVCNQGLCEDICIPNCVAEGKNCGDNGCGGSCGDCVGCAGIDNLLCGTDGLCQSVCCPNCDGKICGDDGCGATCGTCQGCDGPDGSLCLADGTCEDTPTDCKTLTVCASHCGGTGSCANVCVEQACDAAQTAFSDWGTCIIGECGSTPSASCINTAITGPCGTEMSSCLQAPTPISDCFEIVTCQAGCSSSVCAQQCHDQAAQSAQLLHDAWQSCLLLQCGPTLDTGCWEIAEAGPCSDEMASCLTP